MDQTEDLTALAVQIRDAHAAVGAEDEIACVASKRGLEQALVCGDLLIRAKKAAGHGNWLAWLRRECPMISVSTAEAYMLLARHE